MKNKIAKAPVETFATSQAETISEVKDDFKAKTGKTLEEFCKEHNLVTKSVSDKELKKIQGVNVKRIPTGNEKIKDETLCESQHLEVFGMGYSVKSRNDSVLEIHFPIRHEPGHCKKITISKDTRYFYSVNNGKVSKTNDNHHKIIDGPQGTVNKYWEKNDEKLNSLVSPYKSNNSGLFLEESDALGFANEIIFRQISSLMEQVSFNNIRKYNLLPAEPVVNPDDIINKVGALFTGYKENALSSFTPDELESEFDVTSPSSTKFLKALNQNDLIAPISARDIAPLVTEDTEEAIEMAKTADGSEVSEDHVPLTLEQRKAKLKNTLDEKINAIQAEYSMHINNLGKTKEEWEEEHPE